VSDADGIDSIPFEDGLVKRKDVYSDSVSILRQVGHDHCGRRVLRTSAGNSRSG
jgi:hypothetical protein